MPRPARRKPARGFTLVEFILALGLSSAVMGALYSMVFGAARAWKANRRDAENFQTVRVALQRIEEDLQDAVPFGISPFAGSAQEISFIGKVELRGAGGSASRKALARIRYRWDQDQNGGFFLAREWKAFVPENGPWIVEGEEAFPDSISGVSFAYAYRKGNSFETVWMDSWNLRQIPEGVRVVLSLRGFGPGPENSSSFTKIIDILQGSLGQGI